MKIGDSRVKGGPGVLPLQHSDYESGGWPLWNRASLLAVRLTDRFDGQGGKAVSSSELGWWKEDPETRGDIIGSQFWQRTSRDIGAWRFSWPVTTTDETEAEQTSTTDGSDSRQSSTTGTSGTFRAGVIGGGASSAMGAFGIGAGLKITIQNRSQSSSRPGDTDQDGTPRPTTGGETGGCARLDAEMMLPIQRGDWSPDGRLTTISYESPQGSIGPLWPKFPLGWYGISLPADHEDEQEELFYPADPRMVAVHCHGDEAMGSLVGDMGPGFRMDETKMARLQSAWKIARKPSGCGISSAKPSLTWNIGETGCRDSVGGLVWEKGTASPVTFTGPTVEPYDLNQPGGIGTVTRDPGNGSGVSVSRAAPPDANRTPGSTTDINPDCPSGVYGHISQKRSGPIELDCGNNHKIGTDGDGNDILAAHLSLNSYFVLPGGLFDGPLKHDGGISAAPPAPFPVNVAFGFDGTLDHPFVCGDRKGKHRWVSGCFFRTPPPDTPREPPPPPGEPPPTGGPPSTPGTPGIPDLPRPPTGPTLPPSPNPLPPIDPGEYIDRPMPDPIETPEPIGERLPGGILVPPPPPIVIPIPGGMLVNPIPGFVPIPDLGTPRPAGEQAQPPHRGDGETARERLRWDRNRPGQGTSVSGFGPSWTFQDGGSSVGHDVSAYTPSDGMLAYGATSMEIAFPALLAQPQMVSRAMPNYKNWTSPDLGMIEGEVDSYTPITGRIEAWGAQGDKNGSDIIGSSFPWQYTNWPDKYRYRPGTASGGFLVLPPEVGMEDTDTSFIPTASGTSVSDTIFAVGPGAQFGAGRPDLESGGMLEGYTWRDDGGGLIWGTNWYSARTDRVWFSSVGMVGIGVSPSTDLHVKNNEASPINADLVTIESAGDTTGDSFGIGFENATGPLAKMRCLQGALLGGKLQWQTTSTLGVEVRWMTLDERGKMSWFDSTYSTKFSLDPIMDKFLTPDGSAADPALSFTDDDDTGVYSPGADQWAVATSGIMKFVLDRFGNAGINTQVFGGGRGVIGVKNAVSAPSMTPLGGGVLYVSAGALTYKGSSGTVTTIAVA